MVQDLSYRRGRLILPRDIAEWPAETVARWLAQVPVADRARAFRALPLNVAAAGFLKMDVDARIGLLAGLNPANIRYLCGIARDEHLIETLERAGDDVRGAMLAQVPQWRREPLEQALAEIAARQAAPHHVADVRPSRAGNWVRRLRRRLRPERGGTGDDQGG
jgi:Mg/Co/Ni transporter MgtE